MRKYRNRILVGFGIGFVIYVGLLIFVNTEDLFGQLEVFPLAAVVAGHFAEVRFMVLPVS